MKTLVQKYFHTVAMLLLVAGCDADISGSFGDDPDPGTADFSTFVALGDSLTAGYADSALYRHGQENSFPAIMAQQFTTVGGGVFNQPLMSDGATGSLTLATALLPGVSERLVLVSTGDSDPPASPDEITPTQSTEIVVPLVGKFNNMGVAGAKSFHLGLPNYGDAAGVIAMTANPYFVRFRSDPITSMIADSVAQVPSFFMLWIGNFDILFYATAGAPGTVNPTYGMGSTDMTDPAVFAPTYQGLVAALKTPTNKGILVNIPDVSTLAYFNTVPYNAITLDATTAANLNLFFAPYNAAIAGSGIPSDEKIARTLNYVAGDNPVLILDDDLTPVGGQQNLRFATAEDLIVLPASAKIGVDSGGQYGVSVPLADLDVLTKIEKNSINDARLAYNMTIEAEAEADGLLLFDADAFFSELNTTGILYGSGGISSTFAQGGGFSLDGINLTARGSAVFANEMFKVINAGFGGYIPPVNPSDYTTVFYQ